MTTNQNTALADLLTHDAETLVEYAHLGEDSLYVSESDLAGNPDERQNGHIITLADGHTRYVGGPNEPQW